MPGEKPAGSADGRGFTVTVAMTSLVGCAGEDFAAILRALGYRMERRPAPPPEAKPEVVAAETPVPDEDGRRSRRSESPQEILPSRRIRFPNRPLPPRRSNLSPPSKRSRKRRAKRRFSRPKARAPAAAASSEPAMIEVWRPGRPRDERRPPRRQDRERRAPQTPPRPRRRMPRRQASHPRPKQSESGRIKHKSQKRERPERERHAGRTHRPDRDQRPPRERERKRERPIDPNSPFAALLELKARLEAGQKNES